MPNRFRSVLNGGSAYDGNSGRSGVFTRDWVHYCWRRIRTDANVSWGDAGVGALVTALLFDVGSLVLSLVVAQIAASPYGTAASVLALLA